MASINKVILIGNLGRDPELRHTPNGVAVCNVTIATSRHWKDKATGDKVEETEWHRIVFYDRLAEIAGEYLSKGKPVYVEGRLKTRKWTDKDGVEKYTTEIVAENMQMLGGRDDGGGRDSGQQEQAPQQRGRQASQEPQQRSERASPEPARRQAPPPRGKTSDTGFDDMDSDIPF